MDVQTGAIPINAGGLVTKLDDGRHVFVPTTIPARITDAEWVIEFTVSTDAEHDTPFLSEVRVARRDDGRPIAPDMVRGVRLGQAMREAVTLASIPCEWDGKTLSFSSALGVDSTPEDTGKVFRRQRGAKVSRDELQTVVDLYRELRNEPGDTRLAIAQRLPEKYRMSRATVDRRLTQARKVGLLTGDE